MRKKRVKRRKAGVLICLLCLWGLWVGILNWRVRTEYPGVFVEKENQIGDWVSCGDNYYGKTYLAGYSIQIKGVKYFEAEEYAGILKDKGYEDATEYPSGYKPRKICEVEFCIKNEDNDTGEGISLGIFRLLGRDFWLSSYSEWWSAINDFDEVSMGIMLNPGHEYTMKIPYIVKDSMYREGWGRTIETEPLWMCISRYPTAVWARVQ